MTTKELMATKQPEEHDKALLDLKQIEEFYRLKASTIRRERWQQSQITEHKIKKKNADLIDTSGFGFKYKPVPMYGKLHYYKKDVEAFIKSKEEKAPQELLKYAGIAEKMRSGKKSLRKEENEPEEKK